MILQNKLINFIKKLTKREKHLILILITLIISWCLYQIYYPKITTLIEKKEQLKQIKQISYQYQQQHIKNNLDKEIPTENNISNFIVLLEKMCEKNQIKIISIVPCNELREDIRLQSVKIKVEGNLDNIICLLDDLTKCKRALKIKNINLDKKQTVSTVKWIMSTSINLYYQFQT